MFLPVLITKFFIPSVRTKLVRRQRLIDRLNGGSDKKMTLVSAPAGFGKTTLVIDWLNQISPHLAQQDENRVSDSKTDSIKVAWLSLDEGDNDPTRFLVYLATAIKRVDSSEDPSKAALTMLTSPQPVPQETVITALINGILQVPGRIIFVLDDYHVIDSQAIHHALSFLIKNLPPNLHLVITSREDPFLPIARLRTRGQLTELRAADLRFTNAESAEFLNNVMGLDLSPENITSLESRTEGWIGGLQLAAISLQGKSNTEKLIQAFTGSNRLVLDYLIEEVLQQQTPEVQDFLLHTSILNRLSGEVCDFLRAGIENKFGEFEKSQQILEALERANLFLIPLDGERQWYRYHHLFADLLQQQLHRKNRRVISELHQRASQWFERKGYLDEAIQHAFMAKDYDRCAVLLNDLADPLWERGEHIKLRDWLAELPEQSLKQQPKLGIYQGWFLFSTGHQASAQKLLEVVDDSLEPLPDQEKRELSMAEGAAGGDGGLTIRGRLWAIWSLICTWREDLPGVIHHAKFAMENLKLGDPWRRMAAMALGDAVYYQGDVLGAYNTRLETLKASRPEEDLFFYMIANLKVATSLREMGRLTETIEICQQQVEFAQKHGLQKTIFVGWAYALWALVLAERNELEQALKVAKKSLVLNQGGDFAFLTFSYIVLAKTHFYLEDYEKAEINFNKIAELGRSQDIPFYTMGSLRGWKARLMLARGQVGAAEEWIANQEFTGIEESFITYDHVIFVKARLLIAQEKLDEAQELLGELREVCKKVRHIGRLIEVLVLLSLAQKMKGEHTQAMKSITQALDLAEPGGFVRVFVDEGPSMAQLLYETLSKENSSHFVQSLLEAFPESEAVPSSSERIQDRDGIWIEPLTDRELEVLQLIAEGSTNNDIAEKLFLSLNTVKAHTRSIYGKLGVKSRTQAAAKGRTLGIV